MIQLQHAFSTGHDVEYNWEAVLDLDRVVPCVEGGRVTERTGDDAAKAEIKIKMGAMSMTFTGTVTVTERDEDAHRAVLSVKSRERGGSSANADVTFALDGEGGTITTEAKISGKAASMGEGVTTSVLDALINDFTEKLKKI